MAVDSQLSPSPEFPTAGDSTSPSSHPSPVVAHILRTVSVEVGRLSPLAQGWTSLKGHPSYTALMGSVTANASQPTTSLPNTARLTPQRGVIPEFQ